MQPVVQAVVQSWSIPPVATFALLLTALTYLRGAWLLRRAGYPYLPTWRIGSFCLGLFSLWFALASPLDTFSPFVLTAHMLQHMLLMMVAPPLLLLGEPLIPIVRGMPRFAAREFAGPFLKWPFAARVGLALTNPVVALVLMGTVMFAWHVPRLYELALGSSSWHQVEHACFFFVSLIFWWPVIQPWPSRAQWPRWAMVPYLLIADLQNTALSAVLVFSDKVLYPTYAAGPSLFGFTPKEDQAAAGAIMWVVGSLAFIIPAALIAIQCLSRKRPRPEPMRFSRGGDSKMESVVNSQNAAPQKVSGQWWTSRAFQAISFVILFVVVASSFTVLSRFSTDDDDQVLRASQAAGPFVIALYGPADDIPAGTSEFAVLVQDRDTREILLDSQVDFVGNDSVGEDAGVQRVRADRDGENKLLFSAELDFESAGARVLAIEVRQAGRSAAISLPIEVVKPEPAPSLRWSYIVVLASACVLGAAYLWRHRTQRSAQLAAPVT